MLRVIDSIVPHTEGAVPVNFTKKERVIFDVICTGSTNKEIADKVCISERTIKFHVTNILKKLGYQSRRQILQSFGKVAMITECPGSVN